MTPPEGQRDPESKSAVRRSAGSEATVSVRLVWPFRAVTQAAGFDSDALWLSEGFSESMMRDPDTRVPWSVTQKLLDWAVQATGYPDFGLRAAECTEPGLFDLPEYAARSRPNLRGALESLQCLWPILLDVGTISCTESASTAVISLFMAPAYDVHPASTEYTLAYLTLAARRCTGLPDLRPREVHFRHAAPPDASHHERLFQTAVRFGASADCLLFAREQMDLPLISADTQLSAMLDRTARRLLADSPRRATVSERAREQIVKDLPSGQCSATRVAEALAMTPRTLHRRLTEEKTTFRHLADGVRRELALAYLTEKQLSISDIAYLLGFSSVPAFHRAFKRWTNDTPRRRRLKTA